MTTVDVQQPQPFTVDDYLARARRVVDGSLGAIPRRGSRDSGA